MTRLRFQLEGGVQALVFCVVLAMAFMSSHIQPWNLPAVRDVRWFALAELGVVALAVLLIRPRPQVLLLPHVLAGALLVAVALGSAAWAADSRVSAARAASFGFLLLVGWAIAAGTRVRVERVGGVVLAVLAAVTVIAAAGIVELWHSYDQAVLPATIGRGARYNGIGENPNQVAMLLALAIPLALWAYFEARTRPAKVGVAVLALFLDGSLVASGSRGAIAAAFAGCTAFVLFALRRRRVVLVAVLAAAFGLNLLATQLPRQSKTNPELYQEFGSTPPLSRQDLNWRLPLESELGFPGVNATPTIRRKLVFSSGRRQAWEGAVRQAWDRPLLGYGFGMEERAFVDRYYLFVSSRVENSFISTLLQLGPLGVALLVFVIGAALRAWLLAARKLPDDVARVAGACGAVVVAGVALAITQSYLTSVGNPVSPPFWIALFLLGAISAEAGGSGGERERDEREEHAAEGHREPRLDVVRGEDEGVRAEKDDGAAPGAPARERERGAR